MADQDRPDPDRKVRLTVVPNNEPRLKTPLPFLDERPGPATQRSSDAAESISAVAVQVGLELRSRYRLDPSPRSGRAAPPPLYRPAEARSPRARLGRLSWRHAAAVVVVGLAFLAGALAAVWATERAPREAMELNSRSP